MVKLHDFETVTKSNADGNIVYVNIDAIAVVQPRDKYTTLVVGGKWVHVTEPADRILLMMGARA